MVNSKQFNSWIKKKHFKLIGYLKTPIIEGALANEGCGCEKMNSLHLCDEEAYEIQKQIAKEQQESWGCPCAGYTPKKELNEEQIKAYKAIEKATGVSLFDADGNIEDFNSCPYSYYNGSTVFGIDILRAVKAHQWRNKSQLELIEPLPLPNTLVEAIDEIDQSYETAKIKLTKIQREIDEKEQEKRLREYKESLK